MSRIICRVPSSARPVAIRLFSVPTGWTTIAEARDFSVPDSGNQFPVRDPLDNTRAIRPGELFLLTPLIARNKTAVAAWVEVSILAENGTRFTLQRVFVPPNDAAVLAVQGLSLLKGLAVTVFGDRLQARAESSGRIDLAGAAEERPSSEHLGVV
jgi:hypothetical protein